MRAFVLRWSSNRSAVVAPLLALAAFGGGCIKRPAVVRVPEPQHVAIAIVVDGDQSKIGEAPLALKDAISARLAERNLVPQFVPFEAYSDAFSKARDSARRYAYLQKLAGGAPLLLLVEARAELFSQLNGRYRWNVNAKTSAGRANGQLAPVSGADDLGAFLQFNHEREPEALANVAPTIAEHTGILFDSFLLVPEFDAPAATPAPAPPAPGPEPAENKPAGARPTGPIYFVMVDRFANGNPGNDGAGELEDPQSFMVAISRE